MHFYITSELPLFLPLSFRHAEWSIAPQCNSDSVSLDGRRVECFHANRIRQSCPLNARRCAIPPCTGAGPMQAPGLFDTADKRGKYGLVHNIGLGGAVVCSLLRRPEFYAEGGEDGRKRCGSPLPSSSRRG